LIDEELRTLEREAASGDKSKLFEIAKLRGRVGLGPAFNGIDLNSKTLVEGELFDTEVAMPPREVLFFARNWQFDDGTRKITDYHTNHLGPSNSLTAGFAMAVTGLKLIVMSPRAHEWSYPDLLRILEGKIRFSVGVHDKIREWPARDVAAGIKLDGPLILEELVLFEAAWSPSDRDHLLADPRRSPHSPLRLSLLGLMAKPPG